MSLTSVAILMVIVVIATACFKKLPMQLILCVVPIVCGLLAGFSLREVSDFAMGQIQTSLKSAGIMCLFAMMYFTMLNETGMFNIAIRNILRLTKGKVSVYVVMILTSVLSGLGFLTAQVVTAYSIVFPALMPLYKKTKLDKSTVIILASTSIAAMGFIPWGIAVVNSSVFANVDPLVLSSRLIPVSLCFIPVIIMQWIYFGIQHKKQGLPVVIEWNQDEENQVADKNAAMRRPKLFAVNLLVFLAVIATLVSGKMDSWMIFMIASLVTLLINYRNPKEYQKLVEQAGKKFFNVLFMLIGISVFLGVFNGTGMVKALATFIVDLFPAFLTRYIHLILAGIMVIVIRFMPNKIYNSMYPALISVGEKYGLAGVDVIAPFVCNMSLATGSSPFTPTTHVGVGLMELDMDEYTRKAVPIMEITNLLVLAIALIVGAVR